MLGRCDIPDGAAVLNAAKTMIVLEMVLRGINFARCGCSVPVTAKLYFKPYDQDRNLVHQPPDKLESASPYAGYN